MPANQSEWQNIYIDVYFLMFRSPYFSLNSERQRVKRCTGTECHMPNPIHPSTRPVKSWREKYACEWKIYRRTETKTNAEDGKYNPRRKRKTFEFKWNYFRKKQNSFYGFINRTHTEYMTACKRQDYARRMYTVHAQQRWKRKLRIARTVNQKIFTDRGASVRMKWSERGRERTSKHFKLKCEKFACAADELWHCYVVQLSTAEKLTIQHCAHIFRNFIDVGLFAFQSSGTILHSANSSNINCKLGYFDSHVLSATLNNEVNK